MYFLGFCLVEKMTQQKPTQQRTATQQGIATQTKQARKIRMTIASTFTAGNEMGERGKEEERGKREEGGGEGVGRRKKRGKGGRHKKWSIQFPFLCVYILRIAWHSIYSTCHPKQRHETISYIYKL